MSTILIEHFSFFFFVSLFTEIECNVIFNRIIFYVNTGVILRDKIENVRNII